MNEIRRIIERLNGLGNMSDEERAEAADTMEANLVEIGQANVAIELAHHLYLKLHNVKQMRPSWVNDSVCKAMVEFNKAYEAMSSPAANAQGSANCEWFDDDDGWHGSCGKDWEFTYDGPTENGLKFCMNCGKTVILADFIQSEKG